jgi:acetamidase/formamidase
MKQISYKDIGLKYVLSPHDKPIAHVKAGETLILETEDACSGQVRKKGDYRDRGTIPYGNPVVGPIYVEEAERGNTLAVTIEEIEPLIGQGVTHLSEFTESYITSVPVFKFMNVSVPRESRICPIKDGLVYFSDRISIPYQPMVGTIGVAPFLEAESISSGVLPGRHGGNMDIPEVAPGSTILFPVYHRGALLYAGDVHAVQGDGEVSGTAVEMPAKIKIRIDLLKAGPISWPRIETEDEIISVATASAGRTLEDTIRIAYLELTLWMEEEYGLNRFEGLLLCCQVGKIRVGNLWSIAAKIEKKYIDAVKK